MSDTERRSRPSEPVPRLPREEVRRRLLTAAAQVFAERGYAESKLEDIAHTAGFTKGAVYSNFGSKRALFGALLDERAAAEAAAVMDGLDPAADREELIDRAARLVARRITEDTARGQLGLEFTARAARDEETRAVITPMRRAQRAAAADAVRAATAPAAAPPPVGPELAGLILHCLTNGLSMEHLADPEGVGADTAEAALAAVLGWLAGGEQPS
ncbi:TetR/AcrR family transcriptional regulator [Streptomyces sp. JH002]|uniref:TetR/AcrR family transcriptional regulator n=1 Tax=Streptomyces sp. JH002 TaxID=2763259 RepID=UPI003D804AEC